MDPRTGDVTVLPIESPVVDFVWPGGMYGSAGGNVYAATRIMGTPNEICGFDADLGLWSTMNPNGAG